VFEFRVCVCKFLGFVRSEFSAWIYVPHHVFRASRVTVGSTSSVNVGDNSVEMVKGSNPMQMVNAKGIFSGRRRIVSDTSGPTRPAQRIGPQIWVIDTSSHCPHMSSRVGLSPTWQRLNVRGLCW
jgi:hypothetical protein